MRANDERSTEPLRHGAYVCLRVGDGARRGVAAAAVPALAERLGLRNEFEAKDGPPAEAIAYLRRVGATPAAIEDEGLLRSVERDDKRVYEVTERGREEADRRIEEAGGTPWEIAGREGGDFGTAVKQLVIAAKQVMVSGNPEQTERMVEILKRARKEIYTMLAED